MLKARNQPLAQVQAADSDRPRFVRRSRHGLQFAHIVDLQSGAFVFQILSAKRTPAGSSQEAHVLAWTKPAPEPTRSTQRPTIVAGDRDYGRSGNAVAAIGPVRVAALSRMLNADEQGFPIS